MRLVLEMAQPLQSEQLSKGHVRRSVVVGLHLDPLFAATQH